MKDLYFASCNIAAFLLLANSILLLIRRKEGNVSRVAMAVVFFIVGLLFFGRTVLLYFNIGPLGSTSIFTLLQAMFIVTTFAIFPARAIFPRVLRAGRLSLIYIPIIAFVIIYIISLRFGVKYPPFNPYRVLVDGDFLRFDIIFRFLIYITPQIITLVMLVIVFRYSSLKLVRRCVSCLQVFSVLATLIFFFDQYFYLFITIYHIYSFMLVGYLTYDELLGDSVIVSKSSIAKRVVMSKNINSSYNNEQDLGLESKQPLEPVTKCGSVSSLAFGAEDQTEPEPEIEPTLDAALDLNPELWARLEEYMKTKEPWRNPEIRLNDLAQMMMTNRTTLSQTIHAHGYDRFYDYIAKYRIDMFCELVNSGDYDSIKSIFISVGFRSKSGAFKQFRLVHNMTPGEYIAMINSQKTQK